MEERTTQRGFATLGDVLPEPLDRLVRPPTTEKQTPTLPPVARDLSSFEHLKDSPLAEELRARDPYYRVLCDAYNELSRDPTHFTLFMRRLRMMCVEGKSCEEIANAQQPPVKTVTLWAQFSITSRDLLSSVGLQGEAEEFTSLTARLKDGAFELNFQPWLAWFQEWRNDPFGVTPPPPVSGLLSRDIFERLELGESQEGKGVSGKNRPSRSPVRTNREFSVTPFIRDGFFGVEVRAIPESFKDCLSAMPRSRSLALGYHEGLMTPSLNTSHTVQRTPAFTPTPSPIEVAVKHLSILEGRRTAQGELLIDATGTLECLRRGIGPFDLTLLESPRGIRFVDSGAFIDCFPFARGAKHFAETLRLPKDQLKTLGITHGQFIFEPADLSALRREGVMNFAVYGYGPTAECSDILKPICMLGRVQALEHAGKLRIVFDPSVELIDTRSKWYRSEILNPRLESILKTGMGEMPLIGDREVNGLKDGGPRFHMLGHDFCLPLHFHAESVFVRGTVGASAATEEPQFHLIAFEDSSQQNVVAEWSTPIGATTSKRSWKKSSGVKS